MRRRAPSMGGVLSSGPRVAKLLGCSASGFAGCFLRRGDTLLELLSYAEGAPGEVTRSATSRIGRARPSCSAPTRTATGSS